MPRAKGTHWVITASLTETGAPTYLREDRTWSPQLQEAFAIAEDADKADRLAGAAKEEALVCDPYAIAVVLEGTTIDPITMRENIRANGPTTRLRRPDPQS